LTRIVGSPFVQTSAACADGNADFDARIACGMKGTGFKTVLPRLVGRADTQAKRA